MAPANWTAHPDFVALETVHADGASGTASELAPSQIRGAYGLGTYTWNSATNSGTLAGGINFGINSVPGTGAGETIAIVDPYNDPNALSDLNSFSAAYNLPGFNGTNEPTFTQMGESAGASLPGNAAQGPLGWGVEESLDIEWAHAMAPLANILLVEANTGNPGDLYYAAETAASATGVVAVSMSWSGNEYSGETGFDYIFSHTGVTFLAAAGDYGAYGYELTTLSTVTAVYPAASPNVVAVGGTTLVVDANNNWSSETVWGSGTSSGMSYGSGGGASEYESQPSYQTSAVSTNFGMYNRVYPDVSADANPNTGVPIYDSYDFGSSPWTQIGGTSLATPLWAGMIAIADQGRSLAGESSLNSTGPTQTLSMLYNLSSDFHDITTGGSQPQNQSSTGPTPTTYNTPSGTPATFTAQAGFTAQTGYDLTSGIGSPQTNLVIPSLISATQLAFAQGPTSTTAGAVISPTITVDIENSSGAIATSDNSFVTLAIGTNPSGGRLLGTATVQAVNGVATFNGLWIDTAGAGYTLVATDNDLQPATSSAFNIASNPAQPVVVAQASVNANPVTTKMASPSVQASDPNSQPLKYTWTVTSVPSGAAAPTFSPNGTTASSTTTATFSALGSYTFQVVFTDSSGYSQDSSVTVSVVSAVTSIGVVPSPSTVSAKSQEMFSALDLDQFGNSLGPASSVTWSATSGAITAAGVYSPPASGSSDTVTATNSGMHGSSSVTIATPVGWWKLNQSSGATATDSGSGTADNATITGASWAQAPASIDEPYALQCDGVSTVVTLGNPSKLKVTGSVTLAAWIKPANIANEQFIVDEGTFASNDLGLLLIGGNYAVGGVSGSTVAGAEYAIPSSDQNTWVFLAGTYDGTTWRLYRDGQLVASTVASENIPSNQTWEIGAETQSGPGGGTFDYFNGDIGDVRIYKTAISANAIAALEGTPPSVTTVAASAPNPVPGTMATLSVAASDDAGPSVLTYTWVAAGTPPAPVSFSPNGSSAAYATTATFAKAGTYNFTVTIANAVGLNATSSIPVTVNQTPTTIAVQAGPLAANGTVTFTAVADDQFGNALASQPTFTWPPPSSGTISSAGVYTPPYNSGSVGITASGDGISGTATVSLPGPADWNGGSSASWNAAGAWTSSSTSTVVAAPGTRGVTGDIAVFANGSGGAVTLDGASPNLAEVSFGDANTYTIAPGTGGTLLLGNGSSSSIVAVAAGKQTISAPVSLGSTLTVQAIAGSQLTMSGPITANGNTLVVNGGGKVIIVGPGNNDIPNVDVSSGKLVLDDPSILAAGSNLTVGNASLFAPAVAAAQAAPVSSAAAPAAAPKRQSAPLAAGSPTTAGAPSSPSPVAPSTVATAAAPARGLPSARPSGSVAGSSPSPGRLKAMLQSAPPAAGPALPLRLRAAQQAAATVLAQQYSSQSRREQSAAIRALDAFFAEYAR